MNSKGKQISVIKSTYPTKTPEDPITTYRTHGLVEILGEQGAAAFGEQLESAPDEAFRRGVMVRAGRAGFHYWLQHEGESFKQIDPDFHFLPIKKKISTGLVHICSVFTNANQCSLLFKDHPQWWELEFSGCDASTLPAYQCCFILGFVQEFAGWAGMGKLYQVSESSGTCCNSIIIKKEPVE